MVEVFTMPATILSDGKERTGSLRKAIRKWRDRFTGLSRPPTPSSTTTPRASPSPPPPSPPPRAPSTVPPPATLFAPTTQTIISSPFDPRNAHTVLSAKSSTSTLRKRPPKIRRNTVPANYFAAAEDEQGATTTSTPPLNTITTTITANATTPPKSRLRYRLSMSKRASSQPLYQRQTLSSSASMRVASPAPSAANAIQPHRRATSQSATIALMAKPKEDVLLEAPKVIRKEEAEEVVGAG